jgi:hypothetical protein
MKLRRLPHTLAALSLLALPAPAEETKKGQTSEASSSAVSAAAHSLRPDLKAGLLPDLPNTWPTQYTVQNVGGAKSEDTNVRIGVFVVGEDPVSKKSCIPRYAGLDKLVLGLNPGAMTTVMPVGPDPSKIKYMPGPAPVVVGSTVKCTFQVGLSIANVGHNDSNSANDAVIRNLHIDMPSKQ